MEPTELVEIREAFRNRILENKANGNPGAELYFVEFDSTGYAVRVNVCFESDLEEISKKYKVYKESASGYCPGLQLRE